MYWIVYGYISKRLVHQLVVIFELLFSLLLVIHSLTHSQALQPM